MMQECISCCAVLCIMLCCVVHHVVLCCTSCCTACCCCVVLTGSDVADWCNDTCLVLVCLVFPTVVAGSDLHNLQQGTQRRCMMWRANLLIESPVGQQYPPGVCGGGIVKIVNMYYRAGPCCTVQDCCTVLYHAAPAPCGTVLQRGGPCCSCTVRDRAPACGTVLHRAGPCCTVQDRVAPCWTMLHHGGRAGWRARGKVTEGWR